MSNNDKLYTKYLESTSTDSYSSYTNSGRLNDLGLPEINDTLLNNRLDPLSRPLLSLEGVSGLSLNNIHLEVFFFLDRVVTYFAGLFGFSDKQFNRIKKIFIKNWLFGELYIGYGQGYLNEEIRVLNLGKEAGVTKLTRADIYPYCKFRLYSRHLEEDGTYKYTSLISGIQGHKFNPDELVKASWGGQGLWLDWFELGKEVVSMERTFVSLCKVAVTKIKVGISKSEDLEKELHQIHNWSFFFSQKDTGLSNDIEPNEFLLIDEPKEFMNGCWLYISQKMNRLGMVMNPTQKAERVTTGEHYKDLKIASHTESEMLDNLSGLLDEINKAFNLPEPFEVWLSSSLQSNGQPKTTDNPYEKFKYNNFNSFNNDSTMSNFNKFNPKKQF